MPNTFTVKRPFAVDVSYWEPVMNWPDADPMPQHIIARATYGVRQDTEFEHHWRFCAEAGIPRAAYHYWYGTPMYSNQTPEQGVGDQADNFIRQIMANGYSGKEHLWIDIEEGGNTTVPNGRTFQKLVKQWLDHIERETGQRPGIYSRKNQLDRLTIAGVYPDWMQEYSEIWLAWYPDGAYVDKNAWFPKLPKYWPAFLQEKNLKMWQYSEDGRIDNLIMKDNHQPTTFDFNLMYPGYLESLGGASEPPIPPTQGETMYKGKVKSTVTPYLNLRDAPNGNDIGNLYANDTIEADALTLGWLHITKVNGVPKGGWASATYIDYVLIGTPPPTTPTKIHDIDVMSDGSLVIDGKPYT